MSKRNVHFLILFERLIETLRKKLYGCLFVLSLFSVTVCVFFLTFLPDIIPVHYNASWLVDRYGSKYEMLFLPAITIVFSIFFGGLAKLQRKHQPQNEKLILLAGIPVVFILNLIQLFSLIQAWQISTQTHQLDVAAAFLTKGIYLLVALTLIWLGNLMPKARRNSFFGLRTTWSMKNDEVWQKCQRFGGYSMAVCGILLMIASLFLSGIVLLGILLGLLVTDALVDICVSYRIWKNWERKQ